MFVCMYIYIYIYIHIYYTHYSQIITIITKQERQQCALPAALSCQRHLFLLMIKNKDYWFKHVKEANRVYVKPKSEQT